MVAVSLELIFEGRGRAFLEWTQVPREAAMAVFMVSYGGADVQAAVALDVASKAWSQAKSSSAPPGRVTVELPAGELVVMEAGFSRWGRRQLLLRSDPLVVEEGRVWNAEAAGRGARVWVRAEGLRPLTVPDVLGNPLGELWQMLDELERELRQGRIPFIVQYSEN